MTEYIPTPCLLALGTLVIALAGAGYITVATQVREERQALYELRRAHDLPNTSTMGL